MTTAVSYRSRVMTGGTASAAALLGLLAFTADFLDGAAGQVMIALTSSGFAWGLAAFLVARATPHARVERRVPSVLDGFGAAIGRATALLVAATLVYYTLILVGTRRWMAGGVVADGLLDVGRMTALWIAGSVVAGVVLGALGRLVQRGGTTRFGRGGAVVVYGQEDAAAGGQSGALFADGRDSAATVAGERGVGGRGGVSVAAGALGSACGLLSGQGWARAVVVAPGRLVLPGDAVFVGAGMGQLLMIGLPVGVLVWLATVHRLWRAWPVLLGAAAGAAAGGAAGWLLVEQVLQYAVQGQAIPL